MFFYYVSSVLSGWDPPTCAFHILVLPFRLRRPLSSTALPYLAERTARVTGRGHIDINRISGYLPGKIVFFLMQVRRVSGIGVCHGAAPAQSRDFAY